MIRILLCIYFTLFLRKKCDKYRTYIIEKKKEDSKLGNYGEDIFNKFRKK